MDNFTIDICGLVLSLALWIGLKLWFGFKIVRSAR